MFYRAGRAAAPEVYMDCELPEMEYKRAFYIKVVEGEPFGFTSGEDRVRIQLQLLTKFLKGGGPRWMLHELCTQVGFLTGKSASSSNFNSSQKHISFSAL